MKNSNLKKIDDDEIDWFYLFEIIWEGKWKIILISISFALIPIIYNTFQEESTKGFLKVKSEDSSRFINYISLNQIISTEITLNKSENISLINSKNIFKRFVEVFNEGAVMKSVLFEDELVQQRLINLDKKQQEMILYNLAKSFQIADTNCSQEILKKALTLHMMCGWNAIFEWPVFDQGALLLKKALKKTLANVKKDLSSDIEKLAYEIDERKKLSVEKKEAEINLISTRYDKEIEKKLIFLKEQSSIATSLEIDESSLSYDERQEILNSNVSLNIRTDEIPYYLRGFKAINYEIISLESRTKDNSILMADRYLETSMEIEALESDLKTVHLRRLLPLLKNDNEQTWVFINRFANEITPPNKIKKYTVASFVLGGLLGTSYILFLNMVSLRKKNFFKS
ncbi:hypothetical protein OAR80_02330 [Methylophilaceae bacterium]|nr:hypothetical protein [Methylophilaceae bacterium]